MRAGDSCKDARTMHAFELVAGLVVVVSTFVSMTATFVVPRRASWGMRLAFMVNRGVRYAGVRLAGLFGSLRAKDTVLATIAPLALLGQLASFLALFLLGYSVALTASAGSFASAARLASSQLFTAGIASRSGPGNSGIEVLAAITGGVAIALQIGCLPVIYDAFNRRESLVTLMESRAGLPAWGPEVLVRHQLVASFDALPDLYRDWEKWSADLAESYVSYPILLFFRSPEIGYSFVLAQLAVLDAAALHLSLMPSSAPTEARFCLRMGFTALRRIAGLLGWEYAPDPLPDSEIQLSYEEFAQAVALISEVGVVLERTAEQAWPHFKGWRVNYESLAYRLADEVVAPLAPWSGERSHVALALEMPKRPPHRSPGGKVVEEDRLRTRRSGE